MFAQQEKEQKYTISPFKRRTIQELKDNIDDQISEMSTQLQDQDLLNISCRDEENKSQQNNYSSAQFLAISPVKDFISKNKARMELSVPGNMTNMKRSSLLERKKISLNFQEEFSFINNIKNSIMSKSSQNYSKKQQQDSFDSDQDQKSFQFEINDQFSTKYDELEVIGQGFQGLVKKIRERQTNKILAAKIYNCRQEDEEVRQIIKNEFNILQKLQYKNIVKVYELIETATKIIIIMEHLEGTPLCNLKYKNISDQKKLQILKKITKTVNFLHKNGVIHRDITSDNIMYDEASNNIKILDFGVAKEIASQQECLSACGNIFYRAPEMIQGQFYTEKLDIFQLGLIAYEIFESVEQVKSIRLIKKIKKNQLEFVKTQNEQIQQQILRMLQLDQNQRISSEECLETLKLIQF